MAFDASGTAYLAVAASGTTSGPDIVVTRSGDGGRTWSSAVRVATGSGSSGSAVHNDHPRLAASGNGDVVVTWIHSDFGPQGTFVDAPVFDAVSHDGGQNWSTPPAISGSAPFCTGSQSDNACDLTFGNAVAISPAGVLVSFQDTYQNSPSGGTNLGRNKHMMVNVDIATGARTGGPYLVGQAYDGINEHDFPVDARGLQTLHDSQINLDLDGNIAADPADPEHFAVVW
ncbi:MAG: glycoside hydrolase [Actinomycetota bacterium]|nr:glycoside hydrolase [Actinomycetota bacterium]